MLVTSSHRSVYFTAADKSARSSATIAPASSSRNTVRIRPVANTTVTCLPRTRNASHLAITSAFARSNSDNPPPEATSSRRIDADASNINTTRPPSPSAGRGSGVVASNTGRANAAAINTTAAHRITSNNTSRHRCHPDLAPGIARSAASSNLTEGHLTAGLNRRNHK